VTNKSDERDPEAEGQRVFIPRTRLPNRFGFDRMTDGGANADAPKIPEMTIE
jgi:hypothetical protein